MWLCSYNTENGNYHLLSLLCGRQCSKHFTSANIHESESHSVLSNSLQPHGLYSPWNSSGQNTGVGSLSLLQGNLPHPGIEPRYPTLQADSLPPEPPGKPNAGKQGSIPGLGTKIPHAVGHLSPHALEPCSATREVTARSRPRTTSRVALTHCN